MSEFGKRLDGPGGRRAAAREPVLLTAALLTVGCSRPVILLDVSKTGTHIEVHDEMRVGQEVWLKVAQLEIFGTIVWVDGGKCGVAFDEAIDDVEVTLLRASSSTALNGDMPAEQRLAGDDWSSGLAR